MKRGPKPLPDRTCVIPGCTTIARYKHRGWCNRHYQRWAKHGDPLHERPPAEERFWSYVEKTETCWLWTGAKVRRGYGWFRGRVAHRRAYEMLVGPILEGLTLDHLCRVTNCVNPEHLEPVTEAENIRRGTSPSALNARKTHCRNGHPFDASNTSFKHNGTERRCLTCHRIQETSRRERKILAST